MKIEKKGYLDKRRESEDYAKIQVTIIKHV
jgi:hypothetical protein